MQNLSLFNKEIAVLSYNKLINKTVGIASFGTYILSETITAFCCVGETDGQRL